MITQNRVLFDELIIAFRDMATANKNYANHTISARDYSDENTKYNKIISQSETELTFVIPSEYNMDGFKELIETIHESGKYHFNMLTFFYEDNKARFGYITEDTFDTSTKSFSCNSGACIAGFASAIAINWDSSKTGFSKLINSNELWEHIACHYLNIPLQVGKRIFFGDPGCIWSFLKPRIGFFYDLEWDDDSKYALEGGCDEEQYEDLAIDLSSITYKHAVKALGMIKNGELSFDKSYDPFLTDLCLR